LVWLSIGRLQPKSQAYKKEKQVRIGYVMVWQYRS
jgi:hypothetical protein